MKTEKRMALAFALNLLFAAVEAVGGAIVGSVAILSDAVHDLGDATSIGVSLWLERKSHRPPDARHTYGFVRYSVLGGLFTTVVLLVGSLTVAIHAMERLWHPVPVNDDGMLWMAVVGLAVNAVAAVVTHGGVSLNQRAVNLHMLEDVLGWVVVLVGSLVMRWTAWWMLDPLLSIGVSAFVLYKAFGGLRDIAAVLSESVPEAVDATTVSGALGTVEGVESIRHLHIWSLDGVHHAATLHAVIQGDAASVKAQLRQILREFGIVHVTVEEETEDAADAPCELCGMAVSAHGHHHHHHHA